MNAWITVRNLWYSGNYWVRWAILIFAIWPVCITLAALTGSQAFTAVVALSPLLVIVFGLIAAFDPLVIAAIGTLAFGRKVLVALAVIIGVYLAIGVFFAAVPVENDRGLIPLALLTMVAIAFFLLSGIKGKVVSVLVAVLVGIAVVAFMGGREEVAKKASAATNTSTTGAPYTTNAGPRDWVEVKVPILHWALLEPDKNIVIRVPKAAGDEYFLETPTRKLFEMRNGKVGKEVETLGSNISKVYVRSEADVARVEVSFVRM